jgi:hypothetical protein
MALASLRVKDGGEIVVRLDSMDFTGDRGGGDTGDRGDGDTGDRGGGDTGDRGGGDTCDGDGDMGSGDDGCSKPQPLNRLRRSVRTAYR